MKRELFRTKAFSRAARRFLKKNPQAAAEFESTLERLSDDAFDPKLKTHKLKGDMDGFWACSAGYDLRILFAFQGQQPDETIMLITVGTHEEVY